VAGRQSKSHTKSGDAADVSKRYYTFSPGLGWFVHLWKAITRQDHAQWRRAVARHLPRDGIAIDVGAHGGQFTRLLAKAAPNGLVIAVEPSGYARSLLKLALWFRRTNNVVVVAAALGSKAGVALIHTPIKRGGDMGYGLATLSTLTRPTVAEPVAVVTLDQLAQALGLCAVHLIKADIEGFETALIAGAARTIEQYRPAILLEMSDPLLTRAGSSLLELWNLLHSLDYAPYRLQEASGELVACAGEPADGDIFWVPTTAALAGPDRAGWPDSGAARSDRAPRSSPRQAPPA
jgi:FkbM family methyltransferase